ncbi:TrmH family RNA methyltransferase [Virgibacillus proomii]|uniref:TrmH family RNA methyltransferase n=1 Tax=Virgibacillus proomii TaxID=84407 RepID=UPI00098674F5|nr:RNA methyltransferase [Virgibacillus proomii]
MITSIKNDKVKMWKKLHKRKERMKTKTFLIEGFHLVEEALKSNWTIIEMIIQEGVEPPLLDKDIPIITVKSNVFQALSQTDTPQGVAAVVAMKQLVSTWSSAVLLIDAIQDPGNLGTIIRTADAAGFSEVILGDGTVDVFNDKAIRATQGSLFHIPIRQASLPDEIKLLQEAGFTVWASALEKAEVYTSLKPERKTALILGNEANGVQKELMSLADKRVTIPIYGKAESLNVSVAAGVLMYYLQA